MICSRMVGIAACIVGLICISQPNIMANAHSPQQNNLSNREMLKKQQILIEALTEEQKELKDLFRKAITAVSN